MRSFASLWCAGALLIASAVMAGAQEEPAEEPETPAEPEEEKSDGN